MAFVGQDNNENADTGDVSSTGDVDKESIQEIEAAIASIQQRRAIQLQKFEINYQRQVQALINKKNHR